MKRFLLFGSSECYYAAGGIHDFLRDFDNLEDAIVAADKCHYMHCSYRRYLEWWHIYDNKEKRIVAGSVKQPYNAPELKNCRIFKREPLVSLSEKSIKNIELDRALKKAREFTFDVDRQIKAAINKSYEK